MGFLAKPMGYLLMWLYEFIGDYGICLVIFTVAVKLVTYPLYKKQIVSTVKMSKASSKIKEIQQKYAKDQQTMNEKIQEAWNARVDKLTLDGEYIKATAGDGWMGKIQQVVGSLSGAMQGMFKQNPAEIKKGAEHYQVSVSRYIHGCATGEMKTPRTLVMEEQSRKMEEQRKQREAQQAAQLAQQAAAKPKVDPWVAYMQRRGDTTPGYSGGASRCCGNCAYFMLDDAKCAQKGWSRSASDHCGLWKLK